MKNLLTVVWNTLVTVVLLVWGFIGLLFKKPLPLFLRGLAQAGTVSVGLSGIYFVIASWLVLSGIHFGRDTQLTIGLIMFGILAFTVRAFVNLVEMLAN